MTIRDLLDDKYPKLPPQEVGGRYKQAYVFRGQGVDNAFVSFPNYWKHLFEDTLLCGAVPLGGWPRMFAVLKHWRDRRGQARRRCADGEVLELNLSSRRLGKDFLRLLLKYIHRADVWDWTVANARDAQLGETFIRGHAVHNHNIHR